MSRADRPMTGAERMRAYRDRKKHGKCMVLMEADKGKAADKLVDLEVLEEWSTEDLESRPSLGQPARPGPNYLARRARGSTGYLRFVSPAPLDRIVFHCAKAHCESITARPRYLSVTESAALRPCERALDRCGCPHRNAFRRTTGQQSNLQPKE